MGKRRGSSFPVGSVEGAGGGRKRCQFHGNMDIQTHCVSMNATSRQRKESLKQQKQQQHPTYCVWGVCVCVCGGLITASHTGPINFVLHIFNLHSAFTGFMRSRLGHFIFVIISCRVSPQKHSGVKVRNKTFNIDSGKH